MTDKELIETLSRDWIERDGDSFVHIRKTGRLGWEQTLAKGTPYSSYLLGSPTQQDLIERAYPLAKQTISAMDTPFRVGVRLSADRSCTEGKNVYVATGYFDDEALPVGQKLDIFLGLTAHEGSHLLYTDFSQMGKAARVHPLCANLLNIIEDERIERILGEEKPGLANYLKAVKEHYFGRYAAPSGTEDREKTPMQKILNCILGLVRFPRLLKESEMVEYGELLLKVEDILTPYPSTTAEAEEAAERIYGLIREEYGKEESGDSSEKKNGRGRKSSSGADGSEGSENPAGSDGKPLGEDKRNGASSSKPCRDFDRDYSGMSGKLSEVADGPVQPGMEGCSSLERADKSEALSVDDGLLADICEGVVETGSSRDVIFHRESENHDRYMRALTDVRQYVPAIRRAVKGRCQEYKLTHMGMRSGVLDTSKLAEAYQGAPAVYLRHGEVKSDRACVCILVDESGSMIREGRMDAARKTAVLLNEALSDIDKVDLYIYGHSADETVTGRTDLRVYREKDYAPAHALGALDARDNNRDGVAILETARRVRRQTDEEVLMFVISDGAPAAQNYIGREAIAHTKACVEQAERMGFRIVQICINASYDPAMMFRHYVSLTEMGSLARDLGREISRALAAKIKTHVI